MKKHLYIELNNQELICGILQTQRAELFMTSYKTIPLLNSEVVQGVICNPSYIQKEVCLYLKEQNLKNPKTIICIQNTRTKNAGNTLQAALCFSKTPIKIEKIITESLIINNHRINQESVKTSLKLGYSFKDLEKFTNHLTQFNPPYSLKLVHWFLISCLILSGLGFGLTKIYARTKTQTNALQANNIVLNNNLQTLKKKSETYRTLQTHTNTLTSKITLITHLTQEKHDPANILNTISEKIPDTCWLTGIKINTNKQQKNRGNKQVSKAPKNSGMQKQALLVTPETADKKQALTITIQGTTPYLNDTTRFINNLGSSSIFKNLTLVNVKKLKNGSKSYLKSPNVQYTLYAFTISAVIS